MIFYHMLRNAVLSALLFDVEEDNVINVLYKLLSE